MEPSFILKTPSGFRKWLIKNHDTSKEIWIGFYKAGSAKKGMTYKEAVDMSLCFGWIDGIRKKKDEESFVNRFTPRKKTSNWSHINLKRMNDLISEGVVHPAGMLAFNSRQASRTGIYSFENKSQQLPAGYQKKIRSNKSAWKFFSSQAPWYQRSCIHWIISAKQEATREKRLSTLINDSSMGQLVAAFRRT